MNLVNDLILVIFKSHVIYCMGWSSVVTVCIVSTYMYVLYIHRVHTSTYIHVLYLHTSTSIDMSVSVPVGKLDIVYQDEDKTVG